MYEVKKYIFRSVMSLCPLIEIELMQTFITEVTYCLLVLVDVRNQLFQLPIIAWWYYVYYYYSYVPICNLYIGR